MLRKSTLKTLSKTLAAFAVTLSFSAALQAQIPQLTPAQIQQLQNLSEEERRALLNQQLNTGGVSQQPIDNPETVVPRDATSTRSQINQGQNAQRRPSQNNQQNAPMADQPQNQNQPQGQFTPNGQFIPDSAQQLPQQQQQQQQQQNRQQEQPALQPQRDPLQRDPLQIDQQRQRFDQRLQPFGYDLFAGTPTTFAPATNIPVPSTYIVGPGDTVIMQLYGQRNVTHELVITREGQLMFPEVGPVNVSGLSFEDMRNQLQNIVSNQLIGQNASITMGPLRSINVFVLGEAWRPGSYTVSSLSTMTNALFVSGGVTTVGSLRNIRLMRSGQLITELDLYDLLLRGDTSGDARLQPGDVIFIPPVGRTVGITGEVRRPAIYELKDENSASEILALSGGLTPTAYPAASRIERINERGERTLIDVNLSTNANTPQLANGDVIQINSVMDQLESVVMLDGHVQRPGGFQWRNGLRVSDILPSISNMLPNPDLEYALIAREMQPTRRIELIYVDLGAAINNPGSQADEVLQPRDQLHTFGASQNRQTQLQSLLDRLQDQSSFDSPPLLVTVSGNVRFPGDYPLVRNMTLGAAIRFAGGLLPNSELDHVLLERRTDLRGTIAVEMHALNEQSLSTDQRVFLRELDQVIVLNTNLPRTELLAEILDDLRAQATTSQPTQIVSVNGQVRFPGEYPLTRGLTVDDLISMAGGLNESADASLAEITRFDADPAIGRQIGHVVLNLQSRGTDGRQFNLTPFDQLVVRQMPNWTEYETVFIGGEVNSPGTYSITKQDTISSLIARAGGLTQFAEPRAAIFLREELRQNEQRMLNEFRNRLEREVVTRRLQSDSNNASLGTSDIGDLLERIDTVAATGRLVIDLPSILSGQARAQEDPILRNGDELLIPRTQQEVSIIGEVNQPTSHLYERGLSVADYINRSGGFTNDADRSNVYIIKASGEVVSYGDARWFFQERSRLTPGDTIIVPFDTYRPNQLQIWTSVSQILFNISTTLLAIERVGN
ncbi:MAG: SLBB domain-containing protein [Pseudohongiella sp.]|nr:SLBB domain-containing protein [Pseudohongiella sp.]